MRRANLIRHLLLKVLTCVLIADDFNTARATWSIVIVDTQTKEVAVGAATCLTNFDLRAGLPVVVVDTGGAAAQSLIDFGAVNRTVIYQQLLDHTKPQQILDMLAISDPSHQSRQYGIVDTLGRSVTYTGNSASNYKGGLTGTIDHLVYAIQGNVLAGANVLTMAEQAVRNTPGDLPEKLMAGMEAARSFGGDGRCSCTPDFPNACGSPPGVFEKSAHIGFIIVARSGDTDGGCNGANGCAAGEYFMNFNVPFQDVSSPDPVFQLREMFDEWRQTLVAQVDAVQSLAPFDPPWLDADGVGQRTLTVHLRDWQGNLPAAAPTHLQIEHDESSSGSTAIGPTVVDNASKFHVTLTASQRAGIDRLRVTVYGGPRPVVLLPLPELHVYALNDLDRDDDVDVEDVHAGPSCMYGPNEPVPPLCNGFDVDHDDDVDLVDLRRLQNDFTGPHCVNLEITTQPPNRSITCGSPFSISVVADASPAPFYQWFLNNNPIPGANADSYSVSISTAPDFGDYFVRLINTCGTLDSNIATVSPRRPCP